MSRLAFSKLGAVTLASAVLATLALATSSPARPSVCIGQPSLCGSKTEIFVLPNDSNTMEGGGRWTVEPRTLSVKNYIEGNLFRPSYRFYDLTWKHWGEASTTATGKMRYCQSYSIPVPHTHSFCQVTHVRLTADTFEPCSDFNAYGRLRVFGTPRIHMLDVAPQDCGVS